MTDPRPGFLALAPWVEEGGDLERLREVGQQLRAGSGHPRENAYREDVLHADLHLPPTRVHTPPATPHEVALRAYLSGEARFARPGVIGRWSWWLVLLALLAAIWRAGKRR